MRSSAWPTCSARQVRYRAPTKPSCCESAHRSLARRPATSCPGWLSSLSAAAWPRFSWGPLACMSRWRVTASFQNGSRGSMPFAAPSRHRRSCRSRWRAGSSCSGRSTTSSATSSPARCSFWVSLRPLSWSSRDPRAAISSGRRCTRCRSRCSSSWLSRCSRCFSRVSHDRRCSARWSSHSASRHRGPWCQGGADSILLRTPPFSGRLRPDARARGSASHRRVGDKRVPCQVPTGNTAGRVEPGSAVCSDRGPRIVVELSDLMPHSPLAPCRTGDARAADAPKRLRIATWNIRAAQSAPVDALAAELRAMEVDLVALQEVDVRTRRGNFVDEPGELAAALGFHYVFAASFHWDEGHYGLALLSRGRSRK